MAERILITDVAMRDGLQMQPRQVATVGKLRLAEALLSAGVRSLEAASFVSPKAVPQMADGADVFAGLPHRSDIEYWALVPNARGYDRARESGARHIAMVLAVTDAFNTANINKTVADSAAEYEGLLERCRAEGVASRVYLSAALVCPYDGPTPAEAVLPWVERMLDAGAGDIAIADTIGAANPAQVRALISALVERWGADRFSLHLHDTQAMALTNAWAAADLGIRHFDGSVGGLGGCPFAPGAAGNVATEDLVHLFQSAGYETGIDIAGLYRAVAIAVELTGASLGGRITKWWRSKAN